jgi:hypothetical protein
LFSFAYKNKIKSKSNFFVDNFSYDFINFYFGFEISISLCVLSISIMKNHKELHKKKEKIFLEIK